MFLIGLLFYALKHRLITSFLAPLSSTPLFHRMPSWLCQLGLLVVPSMPLFLIPLFALMTSWLSSSIVSPSAFCALIHVHAPFAAGGGFIVNAPDLVPNLFHGRLAVQLGDVLPPTVTLCQSHNLSSLCLENPEVFQVHNYGEGCCQRSCVKTGTSGHALSR